MNTVDFLFKQKEFDTFIWVIQVLLIYPILSIQSMKWTWIPFMYKCSNVEIYDFDIHDSFSNKDIFIVICIYVFTYMSLLIYMEG